MKKLKEKLQELCHEDFKGHVRIIFENHPRGLIRTEWFGVWEVPLIYIIDFLDCEVIDEDWYKTSFDPADHECQLTVKI